MPIRDGGSDYYRPPMTASQADDAFEPVEPDDTLDAREFMRVLGHDKWRIVGLGVAMALVFGLAGSLLIKASYRSTVPMALEPALLVALFDYPNGGQPRSVEDLRTEAQVVERSDVQRAIDDAVNFDFDTSATPTAGSTGSIDLSVTAETAAQSAEALDATVDAFVEKRMELGLQLVEERMAPIQAQIDALQADRADAVAPIDAIDVQLADNPSAEYRQTLLDQKANVQGQLQATIDSFDGQIADAQESQQIYKDVRDKIESGVTQQATDTPRTVAANPSGSRLAVVGLVLGLLIGLIVSLGRRALDKSVRTKAQLERATGLPALGIIPRVVDWRDVEEIQNVALEYPASPPAEAYRTLRTSLHFLTSDPSMGRILLTSATAGEGKTTTLANLAVTLVRAGMQVLMVDADLRKPRLHEFFDVAPGGGLTAALLGEPVTELVQPVPGVEGLSLLAAGAGLSDSSERLGSERAAEVFAELAAHADLLLIDSPPVLPVADAIDLSRHADGVLLIASAGKTQPREAQRAVELLVQNEAPVVGCILNSVSREMGDGYAFEYGYELEPPVVDKDADDDTDNDAAKAEDDEAKETDKVAVSAADTAPGSDVS